MCISIFLTVFVWEVRKQRKKEKGKGNVDSHLTELKKRKGQRAAPKNMHVMIKKYTK